MSQGFTVKQIAVDEYRATVGVEFKDFGSYLKATEWAVAKAYGLPLPKEIIRRSRMTKAEFKKIVADGVGSERGFLAVKIETEGNSSPEIIVNPIENLGAKMSYYEKAYNDDLELISAKNAGKSIRIIDALMFRSFSDLNWFAY